MFGKTDLLAFLVRILIFVLVFSSFPILNHFFRDGIIKLFFKRSDDTISAMKFNILTCFTCLPPLCVAVFFPQIADVLSLVGAVAGLIIVYMLPVFTYLAKLKTEVDNPTLARANQLYIDYKNRKLYQEKMMRSTQARREATYCSESRDVEMD